MVRFDSLMPCVECVFSELVLPFKDEAHAMIAMNSLSVDKELRPEKIQKSFKVEETSLVV